MLRCRFPCVLCVHGLADVMSYRKFKRLYFDALCFFNFAAMAIDDTSAFYGLLRLSGLTVSKRDCRSFRPSERFQTA